MIELIKIEYAKYKNYSTFWWILGIYAALVPLTFWGVCEFWRSLFLGQAGLNIPMSFYMGFPDVFKFLTWTSAFWNFLLGILVVILTTNELAFRTERQNVIDGMSRMQVIMSKFYLIIGLAIVVTLYNAIVGFAFGVGSTGIDRFGGFEYIGIYFIQTLGYFAVAYFFAVMLKKPALAIILYVCVWVLNIFIPSNFGYYFPTYLLSGLNPAFWDFLLIAPPQEGQQQVTSDDLAFMGSMAFRLSLASIYIIGFIIGSYFMVRKKDL